MPKAVSVQTIDHIPWSGQTIPYPPQAYPDETSAHAAAIDWSSRRRGGEAKVIVGAEIVATYKEGEMVENEDLSIAPGIAGQTGMKQQVVIPAGRVITKQ
jgi:hypothetical protein